MRFTVAFLLVVAASAACGSVSVSNHDDGGGAGSDGGGGGADAPPPNVQAGLLGRWAVFIDDVQECTATVTPDAIDVDCGTSSYQPMPSCTETRSSHLVGSWHDVLDVDAEERFSYTGTCDSNFVDHVETEITMMAERVMTSAATGVWQEAAGRWHYLATDTVAAEDFIDCLGDFTPGPTANAIVIDCTSPWQARTDLPDCQERAALSLDGTFGSELMLVYTVEIQRQGSCGSLPLTEPGDAAINVHATPL